MPKPVPDYLLFTELDSPPKLDQKNQRAIYLGRNGKFHHIGSDKIVRPLDTTGGNSGTGTGVTGATGPQGPQGELGPAGADGADGVSATVEIGTVTTGDPGSEVIIENVGTLSAAVLNVTIPRGDTGTAGADGVDGEDGFTATRSDCSVTSASIASGFTWTGVIAGLGKVAIPNTITFSAAAWVRIYKNSTYLAADSGRAQDIDANGEHGLVMEFVLEASNLTWDISPQYPFSNPAGSADYAISVTNLSGVTQAITVTINRLVLES